jgi:hypothetical protein
MTTGSSRKVALIAGITGQDGAYLARFLLGKGYVVHGTSRDAALARLDGLVALGIIDKVTLHSMSPADFQSVARVIEGVAPDEIYNLSGQSSVSLSFTQPAETLTGIALGTLNMLETLRRLRGRIRFYNAGSSECFGDTQSQGRTNRLPFVRRALTVSPKRPRSRWWPITASLTDSSPVRVSSSIMSPHCGPAVSLPGKSLRQRRTLGPEAESGSPLAIFRSAAIGDGLPSTSKPCGACCSRMSPTTSLWPRVSRTHSKNSLRQHFSKSGWIGEITSTTTHRLFAPARSRTRLVIRQRSHNCSIGVPR